MPSADLCVHAHVPVRKTAIENIPVRSDTLLTNAKGEEAQGVQKRNEKSLEKLRPALERVLQPDEIVLYVARARSPLSILEQLTAAWWTAMLAACAMVITNKRLLFFPVERNGTWKESVRAVHWGDLEEVKPGGLLVKTIAFKFKNGGKTTYTNLHRADAKKIAVIASVFRPAAAGEATANPGFVQLCPDCRGVLLQGQYSCPACKLEFKNEQTMVLRSIFLPGGGYFYVGHPVIALIPALLEGILLLDIVVLLISGLNSPGTRRAVFSTLVTLAIFWGLETAITILHCRRYIREFIPQKRAPARASQALVR